MQSFYVTITGAPESDTQDRLDEIAMQYMRLIEAYQLDFQFTADVIIPSDVNYVPADVIDHPDIVAEQ